MTASEAARETWRRLSELAGLMKDYHALERRAERQGAQRDLPATLTPHSQENAR